MHRRWPRTLLSTGFILRTLYEIISSPASAVFLALLLVGFVLTGSINIIMYVSVISAGFVATISACNWPWLNELPLLRRIFLLLIVLGVLTLVGRSYLRWCLRTQARNQANAAASASGQGQQDNGSVFGKLKEFLDEERRSLTASPVHTPAAPAPKVQIDAQEADIDIGLAEKETRLVKQEIDMPYPNPTQMDNMNGKRMGGAIVVPIVARVTNSNSAKGVRILVRLCDGCFWVENPPGFGLYYGADQLRTRQKPMDDLPPNLYTPVGDITIWLPYPRRQTITVDVNYACLNCRPMTEKNKKTLTIHLSKPEFPPLKPGEHAYDDER
jgi:hypothetical protein